MTETLTFTEHPLTAKAGRRQITGLVVPFDTYGMTSAGKVKIRRDAIRLPADLSRVKLMNRHTDDARAVATPVGVAIDAQVTDAGLQMTFSIATGADGDRALSEAAEKVNDGLSVELVQTAVHGDEVTAGDLTVVAMVPIPAFSDARVLSVAAASNETPITAAIDPHAHDDERETPMTEQPPVTQPDADDTPEDETEDTPEVETTDDDQVNASAPVPAFTAGRRSNARRNAGESLDRLFQAVAMHNSGHMSPDLTAALADITYSAGPFAAQPEYVGELWSGVPYARRFVPLLGQRTLKSLKIKGWRWVIPPEVAEYAGDKAAIPSNAVDLEDYETTATRLAGGHDIDRAYYDFGDTEFIESYYKKMAESYAKKSDFMARDAIIAAAGAASATIGTDLLDAVAIGVDEIDDATGATATFALVNTTDRRGLLAIGANDVPAYLSEILKIDPRNFVASSAVPAGTVIVGAKPAMDHAELPGSPIRVNAVNVPNGGYDDAVFGYRGVVLNDADGLAKVTFA